MNIPPLHTLLLEITRLCSRRCLHCATNGGSDWVELLTPAIIRSLLFQSAELGVKRIDITGGDPILSENFFPTLETAKELGIKVGVCVTNGASLGVITIERIAKTVRSMPVFAISMDGCDEVTGDAIRGPGATEEARNAVEMLGQHGIEVWILTVVSRFNKDSLFNLLDWIDKRPWITRWKISPCRPAGRALKNNEIFDIGSFVLATQEIVERQKNGSNRVRVKIADYFKSNWLCDRLECFNLTDHPCAYVAGTVTITADGNVVPCPPAHDSQHPLLHFGNILDSSLYSILGDPKHRKFWDFKIEDISSCTVCDLVSLCGGGCRASAVLRGDGIMSCDKYARERIRALLHHNTDGSVGTLLQ